MQLVALKTLSNGIQPGQEFTESNDIAVKLLIATGSAMLVESDDPPRARRTRRSRRSSAAVETETESA